MNYYREARLLNSHVTEENINKLNSEKDDLQAEYESLKSQLENIQAELNPIEKDINQFRQDKVYMQYIGNLLLRCYFSI